MFGRFMDNQTARLLAEVANYYSAKLSEHGETPRGADKIQDYLNYADPRAM